MRMLDTRHHEPPDAYRPLNRLRVRNIACMEHFWRPLALMIGRLCPSPHVRFQKCRVVR